MNARDAVDAQIEDEIELTEVVELPEGRVLPSFKEIKKEKALAQNKRQREEEILSRMSVANDEIGDILAEDRVDTLTVLFEDEKYTNDVSMMFDKEPSLSEILQEDSSVMGADNKHSAKNKDVVTFVEDDFFSEGAPVQSVTVGEPLEKDVETLEKLDSLDAMISSMITTAPLLSDVKDTLMDTVSAITDTVLEELRQKIDLIEEKQNASRENTSVSLDDIALVEQIKTIFSREFDEKYAELDTKVGSLYPRLEAIEDHLQSLLLLSKRVNSLEAALENAVLTKEDVHSNDEDLIQEQMKQLSLRVDSIEETKDALSMLDQRFQELEGITKEYKNGTLSKLEEHCMDLDEKVSNLTLFIENIQKEKVDDAAYLFGERIARLEGNIELLAKEKAEVSIQNIKKEIEESLRSSIEKEATMAAARIIREELQALLKE